MSIQCLIDAIFIYLFADLVVADTQVALLSRRDRFLEMPDRSSET